MKYFVCILLILVFSTTGFSSQKSCANLWKPEVEAELRGSLQPKLSTTEDERALGKALTEACPSGCTSEKVAGPVARFIETKIKSRFPQIKNPKGISILIGGLVISGVGVSFFSKAHLDNPLAIILLAQASTAASYFVAPLFEDFFSRVRHYGYEVKDGDNKKVIKSILKMLNAQWHVTQNTMGQNEQVVRGNLTLFITSLQSNFSLALEEMRWRGEDAAAVNLAADLIAEAALRARGLYADYEPVQLHIKRSIRARFTNHIKIDRQFLMLVKEKLDQAEAQLLQGDSEEAIAAQLFYSRLLYEWLVNND